MIILDTDAITFLERRDNVVSRQLRDRLTTLSAEHEVVTTVITYAEQTRGWFSVLAKAREPEAEVRAYDNLIDHLKVFRDINAIAYTLTDDARFRELRRQKIRIGTADLKIAAIALSQDALLLTRNLKDFEKVPGLRVEDWTKV